MLKFIAHDVVNDVTLIQTSFCFNVRYGLEVTPYDDLTKALDSFRECQSHAISCEFNL